MQGACRLAGREEPFQAQGGASAKAVRHSMPGCTGAEKASVETEVTGLTGLLRPSPPFHTATSAL